MREMKDSGIEWIDEIPADWKVIRLKYIADFFNGDRGKNYPSGNDMVGEGVIFLTSNNIHGVELDCSSEMSKFITEERYSILGGAKIEKGDIIYCLRGSVGNCAINKTEEKGTVASSLTDIRPKNISQEYMNYCLHTSLNDFQVSKYTNGSCAANLSAENVSNFIITYPSFTEQQSIVDYLDRKCSEIDALTADIETQIETLEKYKRSVITKAVTKGLNPNAEMKDSGYSWLGYIPVDWTLRRGKYLFAQRSARGNTIELQLLSPTQKFGVIPQSLYEELTGMSAVKLNEKTELALLKTIHKGDFCISLRSFQGGFEYSVYEGVVSPAYQVFYPIVSIADGYYKYLFKDIGFIEKMNSYTMTLRDGKNIAFSDFGDTYIPYPPVDEQQRITEYLNNKCSEIDGIIADKQKQLDTLAEYKKSLIYEYVTGKKEVPT